jgi:galactokinase
MSLETRVSTAFHDKFGSPPEVVVRAPGRVNLIGEHTDYNDGFVLPMAIDRWVCIALRARSDGLVRATSLDFHEVVEFQAKSPVRGGPSWGEYLKGVAWSLANPDLNPGGWEGMLSGEVPLGAGLSSSAALEMAAARAFASVSSWLWDPTQMACLAQRAENEWVGVACGIMDQLTSACGKAGHALLIDCRSLEIAAVPLPPGSAVLVLDTGTRRGLSTSAYNQRRHECEAGARAFGVASLRDLSKDEFREGEARLNPVIARRVRHVLSENERTLQAADALRHGDPQAVGRLMIESHESLRQDYEVSSTELDAMVHCARAQKGCYGARMTGGGFGGCAVALVDDDDVSETIAAVAAGYRSATGREASIYRCVASDGAQLFCG